MIWVGQKYIHQLEKRHEESETQSIEIPTCNNKAWMAGYSYIQSAMRYPLIYHIDDWLNPIFALTSFKLDLWNKVTPLPHPANSLN